MHFFVELQTLFKTDSTKIDNNVFRLHYVLTLLILLLLSIIVACKQYFGDPIDCLSRDDIPKELLNTFCWIHATYSITDSWEKKVGDEIPYPGIDQFRPGEGRVYHSYYQWVSFVLFLQAVLFYVPRYFWRSLEGGRIKNIIKGLDSSNLPEESKLRHRRMLVEYMLSAQNNHNFYFGSYVLSEFMNFVNVICQIFLIDAFLGGEFTTYGSKITQFTSWGQEVQYDPMVKVFPRLTKCAFHRYGRSGDVQRHDALCVLPLNIFNEKVYAFLWFWFIILAVVSAVALIYRAVIVFYPKSRLLVIRSRARISNQEDLEIVLKKCKLGDWLIFDLLSKNLDLLNFSDVIHDFARRLDDKTTGHSVL